jgi:hypothetical protein
MWFSDGPRPDDPTGLRAPAPFLPLGRPSVTSSSDPVLPIHSAPRRPEPQNIFESGERATQRPSPPFDSSFPTAPPGDLDWFAIGVQASQDERGMTAVTFDLLSSSIHLATDWSESRTSASDQEGILQDSTGDDVKRESEAVYQPRETTENDETIGGDEFIELDETDSPLRARRKLLSPRTALKAAIRQALDPGKTIGDFQRLPIMPDDLAAKRVCDDVRRGGEATIADDGLIELLAVDVSAFAIVRQALPNSENHNLRHGSFREASLQANMAISQSVEAADEPQEEVPAAGNAVKTEASAPTAIQY